MATSEATPVVVHWRGDGSPVLATPRQLGAVVGENLRQLREERRWTQHELARHLQRDGLKWTRSQVAATEAGNRASMDVGTLENLAGSLGVAVADMFTGDGYVFLTSTTCQTLAGLRAALSGTPPSGLPPTDQVIVFGEEALRLRRDETLSRAGLEADATLAKRLGVDVAAVADVARRLFDGLTLTEERDRRADALTRDGEEPMSLGEQQAHRGHITRELSQLIEQELQEGEK